MACILHVTKVVLEVRWYRAYRLRLGLSEGAHTRTTRGVAVAAVVVAALPVIPAVDLRGTVIDSVVGAVAAGFRPTEVAGGTDFPARFIFAAVFIIIVSRASSRSSLRFGTNSRRLRLRRIHWAGSENR